MLNPLNKLLYFKDREEKEMQCKNNTLSDAGICLVIGCFASAGGVWCTVGHCLFTHKNHKLSRRKKAFY